LKNRIEGHPIIVYHEGVTTALVLGAGGMFAAWEVGAWSVLRERMTFDLIVGASAGALVGWAIACGVTPEELTRDWLDPRTAKVMQPGLHRWGWLRPEGMYAKAREIHAAGPPRTRFALTITEARSMRVRVVRGEDVRWEHLAATCSIPFTYPPVTIDGRWYMDGGLMGAMPLWVAEELGATGAVGLNCLTLLPFRLLRKVTRPRAPSVGFDAMVIEPSRQLGSLRDSVIWNASNVARWIEQGAEDASRALSSVRM
jgi:NTE family protein